MLSKSILLLASAALVLASPLRRGGDGPGCAISKPVLPANGGGKELSAPPSDVRLKYIALGFGVQNYTCADAGATSKATGAVAMLYDITKLYPGSGPESLDKDSWTNLASTALNSQPVPLNLLATAAGRLSKADPGVDSVEPFLEDAPLALGDLEIPFIGHHFFNAQGVPQFVLNGGSSVLLGKKIEGIPAPASADKGPDGTGAVDWLYLGDNGGSTGVSYVYRVLTAGGNPHACDAAGADSTIYSTTYWFYG